MFENEVTRGVAALDAQLPDWREQLDVASLNLDDADYCVLGQLLGNYLSPLAVAFRAHAAPHLNTDVARGMWLGFELRSDARDSIERVEYLGIELTNAWKRYLTSSTATSGG